MREFDVGSSAIRLGIWAKPGVSVEVESRHYRTALMKLCSEAMEYQAAKLRMVQPSENTRRSIARQARLDKAAEREYEIAKGQLVANDKTVRCLLELVAAIPVNATPKESKLALADLHKRLLATIDVLRRDK